MPKKPEDLPPNVRNKLFRSKQPLVVDLQGPGPFQLPLLSKLESLRPRTAGRLEIRLATESGQGVLVVLTEKAAAALHVILGTEFERRRLDRKDDPK